MLVSILTAAYNPPSSLLGLYEAILAQEIEDFEWIIINDGSCAEKEVHFNELAEKKDKRVKIYKTDNRGACAARNLALSLSSGEYIKFIDCDDLLEPGHIGFLLSVSKEYPGVICGTQLAIRKEIEGNYVLIKKRADYTGDDLLIKIMEGSDFILVCCLFPASVLRGKFEWDESLLIEQDSDLFFRILLDRKSVKVFNGPSYIYNIGHENSITGSVTERKIESRFRLTFKYEKLLKDSGKLTPEFKSALSRRCDRLAFSAAIGGIVEYNKAFKEAKKRFHPHGKYLWGPFYVVMLRRFLGDRYAALAYLKLKHGAWARVYRKLKYRHG